MTALSTTKMKIVTQSKIMVESTMMLATIMMRMRMRKEIEWMFTVMSEISTTFASHWR